MTRAHWRRSRDGGEYTARLGVLVLRAWRCPTRWTWAVVSDDGADGLRLRQRSSEHTRRGALRACAAAAVQSAAAIRAIRIMRRLRAKGST